MGSNFWGGNSCSKLKQFVYSVITPNINIFYVITPQYKYIFLRNDTQVGVFYDYANTFSLICNVFNENYICAKIFTFTLFTCKFLHDF